MKRFIALILATLLLASNASAIQIGEYEKVIGGRTAVNLPAYDDNFVYADNAGNELENPVAVSQAMAYANQKLADIKSKYGITIKTDWAVTDGKSAWGVVNRALNVEQMFGAIPAAPYVGQFCAKVGKPIAYESIYRGVDENDAIGITAHTYDHGNSISITMCLDVRQLAHELGHAVHLAGGSSLKSKWVALNTRTYGYTDTDYDIYRKLEQHFATCYAATSFYEDFAETFCALAVGQDDGYERADKWRAAPEAALSKAQLLKDYCVSTIGIPAALLDGLEYIGDRDIPDWAVDAFATYPRFKNAIVNDARLPATRLDFVYALSDKLCRLSGYKSYGITEIEGDIEGLGQLVPFLDIPIYRDPYFVNSGHYDDGLLVYSLMQAGIVNGTSDTTFSPDATVTRQEAAAMLYRALKHLGYSKPVSSDNFADMADVADWAKEAVNAMSDTGIMNGVGGGRFDPNGLYTYNQVAVTVYRLYNYAAANLSEAGY